MHNSGKLFVLFFQEKRTKNDGLDVKEKIKHKAEITQPFPLYKRGIIPLHRRGVNRRLTG